MGLQILRSRVRSSFAPRLGALQFWFYLFLFFESLLSPTDTFYGEGLLSPTDTFYGEGRFPQRFLHQFLMNQILDWDDNTLYVT